MNDFFSEAEDTAFAAYHAAVQKIKETPLARIRLFAIIQRPVSIAPFELPWPGLVAAAVGPDALHVVARMPGPIHDPSAGALNPRYLHVGTSSGVGRDPITAALAGAWFVSPGNPLSGGRISANITRHWTRQLEDCGWHVVPLWLGDFRLDIHEKVNIR